MSDARVSASRRALRAARDVVQAVFGTLWRAGFRIVNAARRDRARPLEVGGGNVVLVVAPHPDDEVAGCGGTVVRHCRAGDTVVVAHVTDGRLSRALGLSPDETAATREREATAAAAALGVDRIEWLGAQEGDWQTGDVAGQLGSLLAELSPDIIYAPSRVDFHPGHHAVAAALGQAMDPTTSQPNSPTVRVYQVQVPLGAALVNCFSDISAVAAEHDAALAAHASQAGTLAPNRRMKAYAAAAHRGGRLVEEFYEMSAARYVALHAGDPAEWGGVFRGLRYLAVTDPAAYLVGRQARHRLSRDA